MFPVSECYSPFRGVDFVRIGFFNCFYFKTRRIVGPDACDMVQVEVIDIVDVFGHAFAVPSFDRGAPWIVYDGNPVGLFVFEHSREAFFAGHLCHGSMMRVFRPQMEAQSVANSLRLKGSVARQKGFEKGFEMVYRQEGFCYNTSVVKGLSSDIISNGVIN